MNRIGKLLTPVGCLTYSLTLRLRKTGAASQILTIEWRLSAGVHTMRQKLVRLLVVIGAFLLVVDFLRPTAADAQSQNCTCSGYIETIRYPLANPVCGYHPFYWQSAQYGPGDCATWCENTIRYTAVPNACDLDEGHCSDGQDPPGAWFEAVATWDDDIHYETPISDWLPSACV